MNADFDLQLNGFDEIDIDKLLPSEEATLNDEPEVPSPPDVAVTRFGDVWQVGPHRIVCGDSRKREGIKGKSGNPKGRPRRERPRSLPDAAQAELSREVSVEQNGKVVTLNMYEVIVRRMSSEATK